MFKYFLNVFYICQLIYFFGAILIIIMFDKSLYSILEFIKFRNIIKY